MVTIDSLQKFVNALSTTIYGRPKMKTKQEDLMYGNSLYVYIEKRVLLQKSFCL